MRFNKKLSKVLLASSLPSLANAAVQTASIGAGNPATVNVPSKAGSWISGATICIDVNGSEPKIAGGIVKTKEGTTENENPFGISVENSAAGIVCGATNLVGSCYRKVQVAKVNPSL